MKDADKNTSPYMGPVKLGPKGQIVIPKEIRDMFGIEPGDSMMILAHPRRGIALMRQDELTQLAESIFDGRFADTPYCDTEDGLQHFASVVMTRNEDAEGSK